MACFFLLYPCIFVFKLSCSSYMWAIPASLAFHLFASFYNLSDVVFYNTGNYSFIFGMEILNI